MGGLIANNSYVRLTTGSGNPALYKIGFTKDIVAVIRIVGEGNSQISDDYSIITSHNVGPLSIAHNSGPGLIRIYKDNNYNYYVYLTGWGHAIAYFGNRMPINNTISATSVDINILGELTQVGI